MGVSIAGYFVERKASGVLDNLEATCVAVSDGKSTALLFSLDLVAIRRVCGDYCRQVAEATGLPEEAVYIHCTHTHTGPAVGKSDADASESTSPLYNELLGTRLVDAAKFALADLAPAKFSIGRGEARRISFIRRYRMKDGSFRTNPGVNNPDIKEPIGSPDETVQLVRIDREGKDAVAVINFQTHPDVIGGTKISADWPGFARRTVELALPGVKAIFFNGTQGDVNHVCTDPQPGEFNDLVNDFDDVARGYGHSRHMGRVVAGAVLSVWDKCEAVEADSVSVMKADIRVPSNMPRPEDIPLADKYNRLHVAGRDSEIPFEGMELTTVVAEAERMMRLKDGPEFFEMPISSVALGNAIAFAGFPGEPFTDIGRGVKSGSPFKMTICTCLTNGSCGYFPVASAYAEGGYEARSSVFGPTVAQNLIDGQIAQLRKLYR